jgi:hypothetical protein
VKHNFEELTVTERAAFIGWRLMVGDKWTTQEVASLLGMSWQGAFMLLSRTSRILPISQDEFKRWSRIPEKSDDNLSI